MSKGSVIAHGAAQIVTRAIEAASEVGEDLFMTIKSAVCGAVKEPSEAGADVAKVAVAVIEGAIKAADRSIQVAKTGHYPVLTGSAAYTAGPAKHFPLSVAGIRFRLLPSVFSTAF